jgi:hypothetical protein
MPTLHKIKREATLPTSPTQVASHFILPNRTQAHPPPKPTVETYVDNYLIPTFENQFGQTTFGR